MVVSPRHFRTTTSLAISSSRGVGAGHPPICCGMADDVPVPEKWRPAITELVDRLVAGDYAGLARDGFVSYTDDPDDASIGMWIEDYPATLVSLPGEAWQFSCHGPWSNVPDAAWVVVDLWTAEEGRSDLSLEGTVREEEGRVIVKIDNVHVM